MAEAAEAAKGLGDAVTSLGAAITSPAKLGFLGYVVLAYSGKIETSRLEFLAVAAVFFALQVFHDDYARIRLNECARLRAAKAYKAAFPQPNGP